MGGTVAWPPGARRLLFVGRFDQQKGIDILFSALRRLGDSAFACIVGDSLHTSLQDLPSNARYVGWLNPSGLEAYYRSAEIIVMPSRWEGLPLVAIEAMRAGLPIIASNVGGLPEIVENGETGLLIPPNDVDALVEAIRDLTSEQLEYMGRTPSSDSIAAGPPRRRIKRSVEVYRRALRKPKSVSLSWQSDFGIGSA